MIEADRLPRISVFKPGIKTDKGVSVGNLVGVLVGVLVGDLVGVSVARVKAAYGVAAVQGTDFYDERMPEFAVKSADGSRTSGLSTDGHRVAAIIAGRAASVAYVEGCL